jgi:type II secretory pathway pseudopilin PulG
MTSNSEYVNIRNSQNQRGIVLLVTLVVLVVLSILGYTLATRVAAQRHRDQYIIDYSQARYGCDSALKYALATLQELSPELVSRPNEPDFSDLFALSEPEYQELLAKWATETGDSTDTTSGSFRDTNDISRVGDVNDVNDINPNEEGVTADFVDPNLIRVRGPYGPPWPFVTEPVEFEIGSAKVKIEIEDENAKYPVGWAMLSDRGVQREAAAGFELFCEWMGLEAQQIDSLKQQLQQIAEIKPFKLEFRPITTTVRTPTAAPTTDSRSSRSRRTPRTRITRKTISIADQFARQNADLAKLLHSSLIDTELLAKPTIISESRKESALKYMGMWASRKVNINTAPRQVLEAAFAFGGLSDAPKIAEEIIQQRRVQPFADIDDLKDSLYRYSDSIRKCEKFITTTSTFFTIRVTVISGVAESSAVAAITKVGDKITRIAVISG